MDSKRNEKNIVTQFICFLFLLTVTSFMIAPVWYVTKSILTLWKHWAWDPFQTDQLVVNEPNDDASSQQDSPTEDEEV